MGISGVARSQTTPGHCTRHKLFFFFWLGGGWKHAPLVNFCILEAANQIVLGTNTDSFESGVVLTHDFGICACNEGLRQY